MKLIAMIIVVLTITSCSKSFDPNDLNKISLEIINLLKKNSKLTLANKTILKTFNRINKFKLKKLYQGLN